MEQAAFSPVSFLRRSSEVIVKFTCCKAYTLVNLFVGNTISPNGSWQALVKTSVSQTILRVAFRRREIFICNIRQLFQRNWIVYLSQLRPGNIAENMRQTGDIVLKHLATIQSARFWHPNQMFSCWYMWRGMWMSTHTLNWKAFYSMDGLIPSNPSPPHRWIELSG